MDDKLILLRMKRQGNQLTLNQNNYYTDTFLSSMSQESGRENVDRRIHKAIKENNAEIIVPQEREGHTQTANFYDGEAELNQVIVSMRQKYDFTKIETQKTDANIHKLEAQIEKLKNKQASMLQQRLQNQQKMKKLLEGQQGSEAQAEAAEFTKAIRLNMIEALKHDILVNKKRCFDDNVRLIRTNTQLKQLIQRSTNKKHHKSKCKLILNSLQQTVQARELQRTTHLQQVEQLLRKKIQNNHLKTNRQQFLEQSMFRALHDRLPDQKFFLKKLHCEIFLQALLRTKMKKLIQQYKLVETSFNTIKKATRILSTSEFVEEFIKKEQKYGELLQSIEKAEKKIQKEKDIRKKLQDEHQMLQYQFYELQKLVESSGRKQDSQKLKELRVYSQKTMHCQQLQLMMRRWAIATFIRFRNLQSKKSQHYNFSQYSKQLQNVSLKKIMVNNLNSILQALTQKDEPLLEMTPEKQSELNTQRTSDKLKLLDLRGESVLSKEYSRRNFRVKTVATPNQEALQEKDHDYDEGSEFDFLRHNRKIVKKNNKVVTRARLKTKAF